MVFLLLFIHSFLLYLEALFDLLFLGSLLLPLCVCVGGGDDCVWFLNSTVVLCVLSSFSIMSLRKRELISLL